MTTIKDKIRDEIMEFHKDEEDFFEKQSSYEVLTDSICEVIGEHLSNQLL